MAMLAKTGWKLQTRVQNLCTEVFQKKYLKGEQFVDLRSSGRCSATWRGLLQTRDCIRRGTRWRIGDGLVGKSSHKDQPYSGAGILGILKPFD
ncbi:hypothetical protein COLO4_19289 [Corchorus olitorius]|uniref:Uncharacterized protein n=1 Tax=Corchorus olitorius TaxID=93759 RepID=A0A1R3J5Y4_9ROSI|nr:hypothetical protein COLO4_19289 [Corchorus olitorius]